jgi:signal transduction histidine kinase
MLDCDWVQTCALPIYELRSPLARLKMALSLLDDARDDEQRDRLKREISRNVGELDELVEEVLLASRLEGVAPGVGDEAFEPVSLLGIAAEEAVPYEATVQGQDLMVRGSERLLRRALRNLLENARRYGGEAPPDVQVRVDGGRAQVEVADRGPGVPEDQRQRIFEPFYRMPGHAEHAGGIGLGLSLVRQIAQRHGGEVQVLPRAGGGSRFVISLPAATA